MYNNIYQEYINNMVGMVPKNQLDFGYNAYRNANYFQDTNMELERFYPELYKVLYPMIQAACMRNTKPITQQTIEEMTKDIYTNFCADDITFININLTNDIRTSSKTNEISKISDSKTATKTLSETRKNESEERSLRPNNNTLNDLIRILLIRELLGRPGNFPPNRPGFPGPGPGMGRPPFRPREYGIYEQNYDIYEHFNN